MGFKQEVLSSLDKIREEQKNHSVQLALNTNVLTEHHVRSAQLEARMKPIEEHVLIVNKIVKIGIALITIGASAAACLSYFLR